MGTELKSNTGYLLFWGCKLYELGLSQEERNRLGLPPLTDAEKAFVEKAKKRMQELDANKEILTELPKSDYSDGEEYVTMRVPLKIAALGWGLNIKKNIFPRVEIPEPDVMNTSGAKSLSEMLANKMDEQMDEFGKKHGFPVIFVFYNRKDEKVGDSFQCTSTFQMFEKDKMHEAVDFARKHEGELGVYDPRSAEEKYKAELMPQPVLEEELPNFCKNNGCSERGLKCEYCSYTAMSIRERDKWGDKWLKE